MNATPLPELVPGSPEWMSRMTASKVAAVLGLSPWESRYSLWHRMAGLIEPQPDTDQTRRGHYLEDAVAQWWEDQHAEFHLEPGGAWSHPGRDWQAASPDRRVYHSTHEIGPSGDPDDPEKFCARCFAGSESSEHFEKCVVSPCAVLEVKTAADMDEWGAAGTDEIPPYYRAQVMWQLDTLSLPVAYVAVLLPRLEFREYRIDYNADEAAYIRAEAARFMESLPGGAFEQRPDLDTHAQTYAVVQQLHPEINGEPMDVADGIGREFCDARRALDAAEKRELAARIALADHMGDAKTARWLGKTIADRRAKNGGTPYMQAASTKRLPIDTTEDAA